MSALAWDDYQPNVVYGGQVPSLYYVYSSTGESPKLFALCSVPPQGGSGEVI